MNPGPPAGRPPALSQSIKIQFVARARVLPDLIILRLLCVMSMQIWRLSSLFSLSLLSVLIFCDKSSSKETERLDAKVLLTLKYGYNFSVPALVNNFCLTVNSFMSHAEIPREKRLIIMNRVWMGILISYYNTKSSLRVWLRIYNIHNNMQAQRNVCFFPPASTLK